MTDDQIKDMMKFILDFYTCVKHINLRGISDVIKEASDYLRDLGLTPDDFDREIQELSGQPIPSDDKFYNALVVYFNNGEKSNDKT